jgi:hypothetical protein
MRFTSEANPLASNLDAKTSKLFKMTYGGSLSPAVWQHE